MGVNLGKLPNIGKGKTFSYDFSYLIPSDAPANGFSSFIQFPQMNITRFNGAFTKVGGTAPSGLYWTSEECVDGSEYKQATIEIGGSYSFDLLSKTSHAQVRPFIRY